MADPVKKEFRGIRLAGAVSTTGVQMKTLHGVEHVVAPIVLLVGDSVIFAINAEHPEFVPGDVLQVAPLGWNGRPLMSGDHPSDETGMLSANIPVVLEGQQFGCLFNARYADGRLQGEVWIDERRAAAVPDGLEILQRIKDGDPVEISVGAFVVTERIAGEHNGRSYGSIWREVIPDHVALLRRGLIGACSLEMGCGTPRAAQHHVLEAAGLRLMTTHEVTTLAMQAVPAVGTRVEAIAPAIDGHKTGTVRQLNAGGIGIEFDSKLGEVYRWYTPPMVRVLQAAAAAAETPSEPVAAGGPDVHALTDAVKAKIVAFLGTEAALAECDTAVLQALAGLSDNELREMLYEALKRVEPNCAYINAVVPDDGIVVYLVDPDPGGPAPLKPYQRTFTMGDGGTSVTVSEDRKPVRRREEWVPVTGYQSAEERAAAEAAAARGACPCGGNHSAAGAEGASMTVNAERITALIENPRSPFEEADRAYLGTLTAERFTTLEAAAAEPEPAQQTDAQRQAAADAAAAAQQPPPGTAQVSVEELTSLRTMAAERQAERNAQKRVLVSKLKTAQTHYNEVRLNGMELEQLRDIAALINMDAPMTTDFVALERETAEPATVAEAPKPWSLAVAKRRSATN